MPNRDKISLESLFFQEGESIVKTNKISRFERSHKHILARLDHLNYHTADCAFINSKSQNKALTIQITLQGNYQLQSIAAGGWLLTTNDITQPNYWFPSLPHLIDFNSNKQILSERQASISNISFNDQRWEIEIDIPANTHLCLVCWQLSSEICDELTDLLPIETVGYFLWGSHTRYNKPSDLYRYLIHGHVYEDRYSWPHHWKTFSENEAHALYVVLNGLKKSTGKRLYSILKEQILLSVLARQNEDGAWLHGMWTHRMECHYRLHCSGMHLLMDALTESRDSNVETALAKAARFIATKSTNIDAGKWFLHDSLETNDETVKEHPGGRYASQILGKKNSNMLVLNTHLDTTIALDRYASLTKDHDYSELISSAKNSLHTVLSLQPAEFLYRPIFTVIYWVWLPRQKGQNLPLHKRILKRIGWKYIIPRIHWLKKYFPRIVMPGGYIDRTIGSKGLADQYHVINLMDLLRYKHRFSDDSYDNLIENALEFTYYSGIIDYWCEQENKRYALGFWAECLYLANKLFLSPRYINWLDDANRKLTQYSQGYSPSELKGNLEFEDD